MIGGNVVRGELFYKAAKYLFAAVGTLMALIISYYVGNFENLKDRKSIGLFLFPWSVYSESEQYGIVPKGGEKKLLYSSVKATLYKDIRVKPEKRPPRFYVFVLDNTGGEKRGKIISRDSGADHWYNNKKAIVDKQYRFSGDSENVQNNKPSSILDMEGMYLASILAKIDKKSSLYSNSYFAVLTVGDQAINVYPFVELGNEWFVKIDQGAKRGAVKKILKSVKRKRDGETTDFSNVFSEITERYKDYVKNEMENGEVVVSKATDRFSVSGLYVTVLGDLVHDVPVKKGGSASIMRSALKKSIHEMAVSGATVNLVEFTDLRDEDDYEDGVYNIYDLFKEKFEYRLSKYHYSDSNKKMLFSRVVAREPLRFYYNDSVITNSLATIAGFKNANDMEFTIYQNTSSKFPNSLELIIDRWGQEYAVNGKISQRLEIYPDEDLRFQFKGRPLSSSSEQQYLKVAVYNDRMEYLIPIEFIRVLPKFGAFFLFILEMFTIGLLVLALLSYGLYVVIRYKKASKSTSSYDKAPEPTITFRQEKRGGSPGDNEFPSSLTLSKEKVQTGPGGVTIQKE